jgi:hypothetical protein
LINPITGLWDEALVLDTFWDFDAQDILKFRVNNNVEDWLAWHRDKNGTLLVKSAYKLVVQRREHEQGKDASGSNVS